MYLLRFILYLRANPKYKPPGLIFGGTYYRRFFCVSNLGRGLYLGELILGGAYSRNFTVLQSCWLTNPVTALNNPVTTINNPQQPCNSTVNMIEQYCSIMFQYIVTAWRIDRGCSRMLEHAKPDLIQQPSSWLL